MTEVYTIAAIRQAEEPLLAAQVSPDELMRSAATAVARTAAAMLGHQTPASGVLVLAGSGGNGGDALYAGAFLRELLPGTDVAAILLGTPHERALTAFEQAGGRVVDKLPPEAALTIDGILGIGGHGGLRGRAKGLAADLPRPILSVDVPSGISADATGPAEGTVIRADVTITFGGLRQVHAANTLCGHVLCADIHLDDGTTLSQSLARHRSVARLYRAIPGEFGDFGDYELPAYPRPLDLVPRAEWDKYSGGVVGIAAGGQAYPGAGLLAVAGAVAATPSMVRAIGDLDLVRAHPEVILSHSVTDTGRVQAWVVGPGRGTGTTALRELRALLRTDVPLLIDADALTLLGRHSDLRGLARDRAATTVLTPHAGEFARLPGDTPEELARDLGAIVLLKGRLTRITDGETTVVVDAGHSWSATPGSGDVLSGILGAHLARVAPTDTAGALREVVEGQLVHATAAWLSAQTEDGPAPTSASRIAAAVPRANARLS